MPDPAAVDPVSVVVLTDAGGAHLDAYFEALGTLGEIGQVLLCDPSGESVALARKALGAKLAAVYERPADVFAKEKPDLAVISVEAVQGPPLIETALRAGCHVFAEKPACLRAADFEPLVRLAESQSRHLMLALANRITPAVREARRLIGAGTFGRLYGIELHLVADQTRLTRPAYQQSWFADRARAGGGHLAWLGIHWLDLAMHLTGQSVSEVAGFTGIVGGQPLRAEDAAVVAMKFSGGMLGTLTSAYFLDKGYQSHLKLWGEKGWLEYTEWLEGARNPRPLRYQVAGSDPVEPEVPMEPKGYTPAIREAALAAAGRGQPFITAAEGLRVLRTVFGLYEAAENGRTVRVAS
ncbi:MAG: Gfo/Idh/MocA family oxidoreductase [Verrucomicrobiales bacterium]|nr:Gfo/Idh/MocA family oxidoreductase [Verrucomicrobiales bacterium]